MRLIRANAPCPQKDILRRAMGQRHRTLALSDDGISVFQESNESVAITKVGERLKSRMILERLDEANVAITKLLLSERVLQKQLKAYQKQNENLQGQLSDADAINAGFQVAKDHVEKNNETLRTQLRQTKEVNAELRVWNNRFAARSKALEDEVSEAKYMIRNGRKRMVRKRKHIRNLQASISSARASNKRLQRICESYRVSLVSLEGELSSRCEELTRKEEALREKHEELLKKKKELINTKLELQNVSSVFENYQHEVQKYFDQKKAQAIREDQKWVDLAGHSILSGIKQSLPLINGRWAVHKKIGEGGCGQVYEAIAVAACQPVAVKFERRFRTGIPTMIWNESSIYSAIQKSYRSGRKAYPLPKVFHAGTCGETDYLVMERLGSCLDTYRLYSKGYRLSLRCVLSIAIQALTCLEIVHNAGFIHRDVKPSNFLVGFTDPSHLCIADFGHARKRNEMDTHKHFIPAQEMAFEGTAFYASTAALLRREQIRTDDLEALWYSLVHLLRGHLPFDEALAIADYEEQAEEMLNLKLAVDEEALCCNVPALVDYLQYVRELPFWAEPNYEYMRSLFFRDLGGQKPRFDWASKA